MQFLPGCCRGWCWVSRLSTLALCPVAEKGFYPPEENNCSCPSPGLMIRGPAAAVVHLTVKANFLLLLLEQTNYVSISSLITERVINKSTLWLIKNTSFARCFNYALLLLSNGLVTRAIFNQSVWTWGLALFSKGNPTKNCFQWSVVTLGMN